MPTDILRAMGPPWWEQLPVVLHQTHHLSVRDGNRPNENL